MYEILDNFTIQISLSRDDLNVLKATPGFGLENSTYISVDSGTVVDTYGNSLTPSQVIRVTNINPDSIAPELIAFSIDYNASELLLTFSETIDSATVNISTITLQNNASRSLSDQVVTLTDSIAISGASPILVVQLGPIDADALQVMADLATDENNTFIALEEATILDIYGNPSTPVLMPLMASVVFNDMSRPILTAFDLDLTATASFCTSPKPLILVHLTQLLSQFKTISLLQQCLCH